GLLVLVGALILRRPARPLGWWLVALSGALATGAAVEIAGVYGLGSGERLSSVGQFVLAGLAVFALGAGLGVLSWRTVETRGWDTLDASVTALGVFLLAWILYIEPALTRTSSAFGALIGTGLPAASLLVLALGVKLAFGGALSTWSGRM